jgi:polyribonucleotide nucleotidyltransferase
MAESLNRPLRVARSIAGRTLTLETGRLAKQADGAIFATYGETSVLATVQSAAGRPDIDFFPLTVEYREKTYAAGKVPGGFFKREMRPRDHEVLVARSIDRPVRPMFPDSYKEEVQIIVTVMSYDRANEPDMLAGVASMAALSISSLPYQGPGATVRVGRIDDQFVINPSTEQMATSSLDLVISGTREAVTMVEAGAMELSEEVMAEAILVGHRAIGEICEMIAELAAQVGKAKQEVKPAEPNPWKDRVFASRKDFERALAVPGKHAKKDAVKKVISEATEKLAAALPEAERLVALKTIKAAWGDLESVVERELIAGTSRRTDGRKLDEIRQIEIELGVLARTHGSALFTRGETQALVTVTLGTGRDEQIIDGLQDEYSKRFMLHYNFPPFSVGEVRRLVGTSRREIGHGNLAERAVNMVMPTPEEFPYSMRVVSEILESNGSSSMASVCGASLALLDAACPLRSPVAGIAMGLIEEGGKHFILSDIHGSEDHNGDMDFKVAGTAKGITALQMDIKIKGLSGDLLRRALAQAREGRLHILGKMTEAISTPRPNVSKWAPTLVLKQIPVDKIGFLIGPGGKTIKALQADYKVRIEVNDDGAVTIAGGPESNLEGAVAAVEALAGDPELGRVYKGKVVSVREFGAFVEIFPGKEGLLHITEMGKGQFVKKVDDVCKVGDHIDVKVVNIDEMGRVRVSMNLDAEVGGGGGGGGGGGRGGPRAERQMPTLGEIYEGRVTSTKPYGAFIEVLPGTEGLCHVSEMAAGFVRDPEDVVHIGDTVKVKVLDIEDNGRIRLSMKQVDPDWQSKEPVGAGQGGGGGGGEHGGGGGGHGGGHGDRGRDRGGRGGGGGGGGGYRGGRGGGGGGDRGGRREH